jgi:TetR/AcrR family transcriptional repressor of nem operon
MIDVIARLIPKRSSTDARQAAAGAIATMVGSIVLARAAGDRRLSDALLKAGRQALRNQTASTSAEASAADQI